MKKVNLSSTNSFLSAALLFLSLVLFSTIAQAQSIIAKPNPATLVTDVAGVLTIEQKQALENKLVAIDDSSSNQIAVVIIPSLDGYPKEEYANKLFREWGIGNKKTNNGILLLIVDAIVKPLLIAKSGKLPFLVLFLGVIGGMVAWGFTGMFKGAIIVAVAYTVFVNWLERKKAADSVIENLA